MGTRSPADWPCCWPKPKQPSRRSVAILNSGFPHSCALYFSLPSFSPGCWTAPTQPHRPGRLRCRKLKISRCRIKRPKNRPQNRLQKTNTRAGLWPIEQLLLIMARGRNGFTGLASNWTTPSFLHTCHSWTEWWNRTPQVNCLPLGALARTEWTLLYKALRCRKQL